MDATEIKREGTGGRETGKLNEQPGNRWKGKRKDSGKLRQAGRDTGQKTLQSPPTGGLKMGAGAKQEIKLKEDAQTWEEQPPPEPRVTPSSRSKVGTEMEETKRSMPI